MVSQKLNNRIRRKSNNIKNIETGIVLQFINPTKIQSVVFREQAENDLF